MTIDEILESLKTFDTEEPESIVKKNPFMKGDRLKSLSLDEEQVLESSFDLLSSLNGDESILDWSLFEGDEAETENEGIEDLDVGFVIGSQLFESILTEQCPEEEEEEEEMPEEEEEELEEPEEEIPEEEEEEFEEPEEEIPEEEEEEVREDELFEF